jgi:hypothetical protein
MHGNSGGRVLLMGVFFVDTDDTLEMDDDMYAPIAARFNPGISELAKLT